MSPPAHILEAVEKSGSDGEGEDSNGHPSYEDEEEYNMAEVHFRIHLFFCFYI